MTTFTHLHLGNGRVTLAIRELPDGEVSVGIAWCSPRDQFSRAMGRETALGPLDYADVAKKGFSFSYKSELKKGSGIIRIKDEAVVRFMDCCKNSAIRVPSWARKDKNYQYLFNASGKQYSMSWDEDAVTVSESTRVHFKL